VSGDSGVSVPGLQVVAPFWLDRPDAEVIDIAIEARRCGFETMWLGPPQWACGRRAFA
jgi:hypothetical protein